MFKGQVEEVSNREDVELLYSIVDADTGDEIDLSSSTIYVELQDSCGGVMWGGSIADGDVTLPSTTVMRILIPRTSMVNFDPGIYKFGMTITNGGLTKSAIVGTIAVLDGAVPQ